MDAGIVALLGAAIGVLGAAVGAGGAVGAAAVTGRHQAKNQRTQAQRESRRHVYADFLRRVHEYMATTLDTVPTDPEALKEALHATMREIDHAISLIAIEGPEAVVRSANRIFQHLRSHESAMAEWLATPEGDHHTLEGMEIDINRSIADFQTKARASLDNMN
ncbi:hypothetical protein [Streptomyces pseudovenezuelae]|uniref:hypothetical protein n=1 Tax=Streptomyces pseudovenezuelae TaxID=67350 RepID=UPI0036ED823D